MRSCLTFRLTPLLLAVVLAISVAHRASAQQSSLGRVEFPVTTESAEARAHFLRGVGALHSFWFEEALAEFRAATKADPGFVMGYWGEAMALNHPLWAEQETETAREVLRKIKDDSKVTPRERAYVAAVRALYGEGDKEARDAAYAAAMEKIYRAHTDDLEAAAFYSLSLLGMVRPGEKGFTRQMRAGAVALVVYHQNPTHPGAAHYLIHAFDDPEHAILALPAARRYAEIAPEAHHARHMPSHIFIQLGMWPEASASNESSWEASVNWVRRKNLSPNLRDYHSLHWLTYVYLQQGRYEKAAELIALVRKAMAEPGADPARMSNFYPVMAAAYVVETERWNEADTVFETPQPAPATMTAHPASPGAHAAHDMPAPVQGSGQPLPRFAFQRSFALSTQGLGHAALGRAAEAEKTITELRDLRRQFEERGGPFAYRAKLIEIRELEVAAALKSSQGKHDEAIELMKRAAALEEETSPPSGPPDTIKPSHELFGEILLRAGRPKEAAAQFAISLTRQPNRARSLLGAARAAAKSGDREGAQVAYTNFLRTQAHADRELPEVKEARDYLAQTAAQYRGAPLR